MPNVFTCERCRLPISLHSSLSELSVAQTQLLTGAKVAPVPLDRYHAPMAAEAQERIEQAMAEFPLEGPRHPTVLESTALFVVVPGPNGTPTPMEPQDSTRAMEEIFRVLSSRSDIDYPVCSDCVGLLVAQMREEFDVAVATKDQYLQFLRKLQGQPGPTPPKALAVLSGLEKLEAEEAALMAQLRAAEQERDLLQQDLVAALAELEALGLEEQQHERELNRYDLEAARLAEEHERTQRLYALAVQQLGRLRQSDVYGDVFRIGTKGPFGLINGLRLGNTDHERVLWHEINAALGQVVLLLATLLEQLGVQGLHYTLRPMGLVSRIEDSQSGTVLEAFSLGEYSVERIFNHNKMDAAMVALLEVVVVVNAHLEQLRNEGQQELPYRIVKDTVGGMSIKLGTRTTSKDWTTACKCLLIDLKWVLAFAGPFL